MSEPTLFDAGTTAPSNDAAPLGGGAGIHVPNCLPHSTLARLPLVPPVRRNAPGTSMAAALSMIDHARTLRAAVLALLVERGHHGATDQEMQEALGLPSNTQVPRRWELVDAGAVVASGRTRKTRSNRRAIVWVVAGLVAKAEGGAA